MIAKCSQEYLCLYLGSDPLTCRGGYVFLFRELEYSPPPQNSTLGYRTKTLNQIIFFSSPKSEYFFQQHWESEYYFLEKPSNTLYIKNTTKYITEHNVTKILKTYKKSLKIPKGESESVYRRRTDNTMVKRKSTKGQTTIYKTYI